MKIIRLNILFCLLSLLNNPSYSLPTFSSPNNLENFQNNSEELKNIKLLNQSSSLKQKQNEIFFQNIKQVLFKNEPTKQNLKSNPSLNPQSSTKNNFSISFKKTFKDLSKTYVSPFGKPINRAPDESLINCQSKECYE